MQRDELARITLGRSRRSIFVLEDFEKLELR